MRVGPKALVSFFRGQQQGRALGVHGSMPGRLPGAASFSNNASNALAPASGKDRASDSSGVSGKVGGMIEARSDQASSKGCRGMFTFPFQGMEGFKEGDGTCCLS